MKMDMGHQELQVMLLEQSSNGGYDHFARNRESLSLASFMLTAWWLERRAM
jgi:hypothetical protein